MADGKLLKKVELIQKNFSYSGDAFFKDNVPIDCFQFANLFL